MERYEPDSFRLCSRIIGNRKDDVCLRLHGQNSSSPSAAISAMLDSKGRAFVLIQALYIR